MRCKHSIAEGPGIGESQAWAIAEPDWRSRKTVTTEAITCTFAVSRTHGRVVSANVPDSLNVPCRLIDAMTLCFQHQKWVNSLPISQSLSVPCLSSVPTTNMIVAFRHRLTIWRLRVVGFFDFLSGGEASRLCGSGKMQKGPGFGLKQTHS
jgi:hypothetical protein